MGIVVLGVSGIKTGRRRRFGVLCEDHVLFEDWWMVASCCDE
jgi:hypothetical protein